MRNFISSITIVSVFVGAGLLMVPSRADALLFCASFNLVTPGKSSSQLPIRAKNSSKSKADSSRNSTSPAYCPNCYYWDPIEKKFKRC
jgi:hypothetical protein